MLYDLQRAHPGLFCGETSSMMEYHPSTRGNMATFMEDMDVLGNLREAAVPFFMCPGGIKARALMFEPFAGVYFGTCGPEAMPVFHESTFVCDVSCFVFMLLLEGRFSCEISGESGRKRFDMGKNSFIAGDWTGISGKSTMVVQNSYCHVALAAFPEAVEEHFGRTIREDMERVLHRHDSGSRRAVATVGGQASPDLVSSGRRLLAMPKSTLLDTMELRSASLDFFTRVLRNAAAPAVVPPAALPAHDVLALTRLKERVERNCLEDIGVAELCAAAGMSESKANKAFKQLFGVTIARHVHNCKMQYAHAMLSARKRNVSECAFEVGYANIGHFIAAYRRHYGHTPGNAFRRAS